MAVFTSEEAREIGTAIAIPIKNMLPVPVGAGGLQPIEGEVIPAGSNQNNKLIQVIDDLKDVVKNVSSTRALGKQEVESLRFKRQGELLEIKKAQEELDKMSEEEAGGARGQQLKQQIDTRKESVEEFERAITDAGFAVEEFKKEVAEMSTPLGDIYNALIDIALLPDKLFGDTLKAFDKMTGNIFRLNERYEDMKKAVTEFANETFVNLKHKAMEFGKKSLDGLKKGFNDFKENTLPDLQKSFGGLITKGALLAKSFLGIVASNLLAIATNPFVLLAVAIGGLLLAIQQFAPKLFETIKGIGQAVLDGVDSVITTLLNGIISLVNKIPGINIDKIKTEKEKRAEKEDPLHHLKKSGMMSDGAEGAKVRQAILGRSVADDGSRFVRAQQNQEMQTERKKEMLAVLTSQRAADAGLTSKPVIVNQVNDNKQMNTQSNAVSVSGGTVANADDTISKLLSAS